MNKTLNSSRFLRANQYLFASIFYSIMTGILASVVFAATASVAMYCIEHKLDGIVIGASLYVLMLSPICCFIAFFSSIFMRRISSFSQSKFQGFIVTGFAALLANIICFVVFKKDLWTIYLLIFSASILTIFFGSKIYYQTWNKLERLFKDAQSGHGYNE